MSKRIAIVGAGASGVVACKVLLQAGHDVTIYEAGSHIGGLWIYENDNGAAVAYRNLYILTPKRYTQWRDFPFDDATPEYAHHTDMARYLHQYADFFGVTERVRFNDRVLEVKPVGPVWEVTSQSGSAEYDAVVTATGHFHSPRWPPILDGFAGELMHSADYREPAQAANRRVLVIGLGNSACDVAADVSWVASKAIISARTPVFSGPRWLFGHSFLDILRRFQGVHVPKSLAGKVAKLMVRAYWGDVSRWGFREPSKGAHGVLHEFLLPILKYGRLQIRGDITAVNGKEVTFADGSSEEFDLIISATGYELEFPFLDGLVRMNEARSELDDIYLRAVSIDHPGLYFVGLSNNNGVANTPSFQRQAELIAHVLGGHVTLPSPDEMRVAVIRRRERTKELYLNTPRHDMEERHPDYVIELVHEMIDRRNGHGPLPKPATRRAGKRCWLCGSVIEPGKARMAHATDWGSLRWVPGTYTQPVKLCPDCFRSSLRTDVSIAGSLVGGGAVGLVATAGAARRLGRLAKRRLLLT
jgi:cation diffusion facilitator CzcD-associated flavoprotein CzcO